MPGKHFVTYCGHRFCPYEPEVKSIDIKDIAHALSLICRFGGHIKEFYSVAQHSLIVCKYTPKPLKLHALLHDAAEAYIGDIITPLKTKLYLHTDQLIPEHIRTIETLLLKTIWERFNIPFLSPDENKIIKDVDHKVFHTEASQLLNGEPYYLDKDYVIVDEIIKPTTPALAKFEYLSTFHNLMRAI